MFFTSSGKRTRGLSAQATSDKKSKTATGDGKENVLPSLGPQGRKSAGLAPKGKNARVGKGEGKTGVDSV